MRSRVRRGELGGGQPLHPIYRLVPLKGPAPADHVRDLRESQMKKAGVGVPLV